MSHDTGYANKFDFELKIKNYKLACQIAKKRIANIRIKINKFYSFSPKKLKSKCWVVSKWTKWQDADILNLKLINLQ